MERAKKQDEASNSLEMDCKVLVLGAGGLGCEILKNLTMMRVKEVHIVDMDTIELTNLNRQFLFRDEDINSPKATTAAQYINDRPSLSSRTKVIPYVQDLTNFPTEFFQQFQFIISGLDAIEPRRFVNKVLLQLTKESNYDICIQMCIRDRCNIQLNQP